MGSQYDSHLMDEQTQDKSNPQLISRGTGIHLCDIRKEERGCYTAQIRGIYYFLEEMGCSECLGED